jgi:hypothetical protein
MDAPYRVPDPPPPPPPPTLIQRLKNVRGAKPVLGVVTIILVITAIVTLLTIPGLGILYALAKTGEVVTQDDMKLAPFVSLGAIGCCVVAYKVLCGFIELANEVGKNVFDYADRKTKSEEKSE